MKGGQMADPLKRSLRIVLAGSLVLGGSLTVAIGEAVPVSAATVVGTIPVGNAPAGVSSDGTHVWVTNGNDNTVTELSASTGGILQTIDVEDPQGISSDRTHVWVANATDGTVTELSASTGTVIQTITVGKPAPRNLVRRYPRLGSQRYRQHGHRAECLDRQRSSRPSPLAMLPTVFRRTALTSG